MWKPVDVPFQNPSQLLSTLPTTDEIRACTNVLWETQASKIVALNDEIVVKYGTCVDVREGQALVYLERYVPEVPAPRLYAMYYPDDSKQLFLIIQRAPGVQLDKIWPSLEPSEKDDIITKLERIFDTLRKAECPWPDFFGGLDGGGIPHYLFYSQHGDRKFLGPFSGEPAFVAGLVGNYRALVDHNNHPDYKARFYEKYFERVLKGHRPTLTHGDVQQKNIIISENGRNDQGGRSFDVVLVDWENSGWLPEFWEFFCASDRFVLQWEEDWSWRIQDFIEVLPAEVAMMQLIDKELGY
ncbi:phosphotransferase enzyme family protein [Penicillium herquei]|nr:phosphotransferase enzyme family protein [Penicillium herquei]